MRNFLKRMFGAKKAPYNQKLVSSIRPSVNEETFSDSTSLFNPSNPLGLLNPISPLSLLNPINQPVADTSTEKHSHHEPATNHYNYTPETTTHHSHNHTTHETQTYTAPDTSPSQSYDTTPSSTPDTSSTSYDSGSSW